MFIVQLTVCKSDQRERREGDKNSCERRNLIIKKNKQGKVMIIIMMKDYKEVKEEEE